MTERVPSGAESARASSAAHARRAGWRAAMILGTIGLASCAEKVTTVDPGATPEGQSSNQTRLLAWGEIPNVLIVFDRPPETDPPTPPIPVALYYVVNAVEIMGQFVGGILDSTTASSYEVHRREPNGGYRELFDFSAVPARRWIDRGWEVYRFTDPDTVVPSHYYRGRGIVRGAVTLGSPVTEEARVSVRHGPGQLPDINYTGDPTPPDSLFLMEWDSVPGATAYIIHVYQWSFSLTDLLEQLSSGNPAPLYIGKSVDILVAHMPAPSPSPATVSFRMPMPDARPPEARVMTVRQTRMRQDYLVRIAAVDASGQLLAYTYGDFGPEIVGIEIVTGDQFAAFPMGAVRVVPTRSSQPARARVPRFSSGTAWRSEGTNVPPSLMRSARPIHIPAGRARTP